MYCVKMCVFSGSLRRTELANIGDRLGALEKEHQFTHAFGKFNRHWILRHSCNWGT